MIPSILLGPFKLTLYWRISYSTCSANGPERLELVQMEKSVPE
jgi:hypothetical protein